MCDVHWYRQVTPRWRNIATVAAAGALAADAATATADAAPNAAAAITATSVINFGFDQVNW